jgi:hypothetical protein
VLNWALGFLPSVSGLLARLNAWALWSLSELDVYVLMVYVHMYYEMLSSLVNFYPSSSEFWCQDVLRENIQTSPQQSSIKLSLSFCVITKI